MADPKQFTIKNNPITYTGAFIKLENQRNREQVYKIHEMIELEKMRVLTVENP